VLTDSWPFARHYVHSAMVGWQGYKMSKSRGNLVFVSALRHAGVDANAIRLALLAHHYREDWAWTEYGLEEATARLALWRAAADGATGPETKSPLAAVRAALADDLQTPLALAALDDWAHRQQAGDGDDASAPEFIRQLADALLGIRV
jgi:L-cysteine:1D-myo-inositol 2-amino-2-deoxy-alpha-D-glucopyranoside ligase